MTRGRGEVPGDDALLRRIVARDETAFHLLYRRHAPAVMAVSYRFLGDRESAADVTQLSFLRLWTRAATIDARDGRLRPWLLLVARNAAIDRGRRKRLGAIVFERLVPMLRNEPDVAETIVRGAQKRATHDLLDTLGAEQRQIVELAYFGELTQTEIATLLELPLGTVKSRLRLAFGHLRERARASGWESK